LPKQTALEDNMPKFTTTVTGCKNVVIGDRNSLTIDAGRTQSKIIISRELQQFLKIPHFRLMSHPFRS